MKDLSAKLITVLFCAPAPIARKDVCSGLNITPSQLDELIPITNQLLDETGLTILDGAQIAIGTQAQYADYIEKFFQTEPQPLSQAALEVLGIIAYEQPISRAAIDEIRGVSSEQSLRNLLNKQLISKSIRKNRQVYTTTTEFLALMGINNIKDLPIHNESSQT